MVRTGLVGLPLAIACVALGVAPHASAPARLAPVAATSTLPAKLADTGGGTQVVIAETSGGTNSSRDGKLTWWWKKGSTWLLEGSTNARFGAAGLSDNRLEGDLTTPTGVYALTEGFGLKANPGKIAYHKVDSGSWWDENSLDAHYNTWYENCPSSICWTASTRSAHSSEHLADFTPQYNLAVLIDFNTGATKVRPPDRPSGSGIFLHVNGSGYTAGCVSISQVELRALLTWLNPGSHPHIVIGNSTSIYRF